MSDEERSWPCACAGSTRRHVLELAVGFGLSVGATAEANAETPPEERRPVAGDRLVHAAGPKKNEPLLVDDLPLGGPQVMAFPMDAASGVVRSGSRFNEVAVVRLDPAQLADSTKSNAADGIVAYSAICSHEGCPVNMWEPERHNLFCSCHGSQFDPRDNGTVVDGPAPRRLAVLPLKVADGVVTVAAEFKGRLGIYKPS